MSAYDNINVDHRTLNNCLYEGSLYLNRLMFILEPISEFVLQYFKREKFEVRN